MNHSSGLGLDARFVAAPWLLDWYGIEGPVLEASFEVGGRWISLASGRLYVDAAPVTGGGTGSLVGAVAAGSEIAAVGVDEIVLLDAHGEIVERFPAGLYLPGDVEGVAPAEDGLRLLSQGALFAYEPEHGRVTESESAPADIAFVTEAALPGEIRAGIESAYRGTGLSLERVLSDLHSGRLLGISGVVVMDLAACALGFLAVSGVLIWFRR